MWLAVIGDWKRRRTLIINPLLPLQPCQTFLTGRPNRPLLSLRGLQESGEMPTFNGVVAQFSAAGTHYAGAVQPYALSLFVALLSIEVLVTCVQFMLDQGDALHYFGRLIRHVLSAGFLYLMIVNAFPWMSLVMQSFAR